MIERGRQGGHAAFLLLMALAGCNDNENARVAQVAQEAARQQAAQNQEMARLNQEVARAHQQQIDAEAQARETLLVMSQDVQVQQNALEAERQDMAGERRELAEEQRWDSILGPTMLGIASLAASMLPLILCWYLLDGLRHDRGDEADLAQLLVLDMAADAPVLLPPPVSMPQVACDDDRESQQDRLGFNDAPPF